jgi:hypothetical protein
MCSARAQRLLRREGPVANAKADAEGLPFDVRIEPFERGFVPPDNQPQTGCTLSFDFASLEDLAQKLATQTSALELSGMMFERNGKGVHVPRQSLAGGAPRLGER